MRSATLQQNISRFAHCLHEMLLEKSNIGFIHQVCFHVVIVRCIVLSMLSCFFCLGAYLTENKATGVTSSLLVCYSAYWEVKGAGIAERQMQN
jgi:hypothetical protein